MNLLMISVDFYPHRDGVSALAFHYARRLAERGHRVTVVAPRDHGTRALDARLPFSVYRFPGYRWGLLRAIPFACWALTAWWRTHPDVVLPMNIGYGGLLAWLGSRLGRCHYVMFAYGLEFRKANRCRGWRALYRDVYRRALGVVVISHYTAAQLGAFGVSPNCMCVVPPGSESGGAPTAETQSPGQGVRHIGTCGRLIWRKGHDLVIDALPDLLRDVPDLCYVIAGEGPERVRLEERARNRGVHAHVRFLGQVSQAELPSFYRSLDVFVMPGRDDAGSGHVEGFGIVFLEAAQQGLPAVATRTGGIPEAVLDGLTGLLVPPDDVPALTEALLALLRNPEKCRAMGAAARQRARMEFTWDHQVDRAHDWLLTRWQTGTAPTERKGA